MEIKIDYLVFILSLLTFLFSILALVVDIFVIETLLLEILSTKQEFKIFDLDDETQIIFSIVFTVLAIIGAFVAGVASTYNLFQEKNSRTTMIQLISFVLIFIFSSVAWALILEFGERSEDDFKLLFEEDLNGFSFEINLVYKAAFAFLVSNSVMSLINFALVYFF